MPRCSGAVGGSGGGGHPRSAPPLQPAGPRPRGAPAAPPAAAWPARQSARGHGTREAPGRYRTSLYTRSRARHARPTRGTTARRCCQARRRRLRPSTTQSRTASRAADSVSSCSSARTSPSPRSRASRRSICQRWQSSPRGPSGRAGQVRVAGRTGRRRRHGHRGTGGGPCVCRVCVREGGRWWARSPPRPHTRLCGAGSMRGPRGATIGGERCDGGCLLYPSFHHGDANCESATTSHPDSSFDRPLSPPPSPLPPAAPGFLPPADGTQAPLHLVEAARVPEPVAPRGADQVAVGEVGGRGGQREPARGDGVGQRRGATVGD